MLTFSVNALFGPSGATFDGNRPLNEPKDGLQPLTGIIETDWAPFTFTMNWKFTRKLAPVAFEQDEPFCMIFPVKRGTRLNRRPGSPRARERSHCQRGLLALDGQPAAAWSEELQQPGSDAQARKWRKGLFRGHVVALAPPRPIVERAKKELKRGRRFKEPPHALEKIPAFAGE